MLISVRLDSTHNKNKQSIAEFLPLFKPPGHSFERRAFEFH